MTTITLTLTVTDEERARLIARFIETAQAVTGEIDDEGGVPSDPNGSKVDSTGVVWDARYHGVKMTKNQDGTWRRKKSMTDQEKADADAYEAGCRGAPTATAAAAAGVSVTAPAADVPAFLQTGVFAPAAAPVMTMPGMPAFAAPAPVVVPVSYPDLIAAFQATVGRIGQPKLEAEIAGVYQRAGVTDMAQLETDGDKRINVKTELEKLAA